MMGLRDLSLLLLAWLGALVISFGVYEWRQENDLDDLRDRLGDIEVGFGGGDLNFDPEYQAAGAVDLTIVSATNDDEVIQGIIEGRGSLVLRVENVSLDTFNLTDLTTSGTESDGQACQVFVGQDDAVSVLEPGQSDELRLIWDCEDLQTLLILGREFVVRG